MNYYDIEKGIFVARLNRFVATVLIGGKEELCHIKNTGRLKELLLPGAKVYVQKAARASRKTKYNLISVYKNNRLVNIDSQAANKVAAEYFPTVITPLELLKPETKYNNSRFDFYMESDTDKIFAEVKGVTLERDGVAMFPDAPTERGLKHLSELAQSIEEGYKAIVLFVIQMKGIKHFSPNYETHMAFGEKLKEVKNKGVKLMAVDCNVSQSSLSAANPIEIIL